MHRFSHDPSCGRAAGLFGPKVQPIQLAPGADDLFLDDSIVASVVQSGLRQPYTWTAELLEDLPRSRRPSPFEDIGHSFASLEELCAWLGHPPVKTNNRHTAS